MTRAGGRMYDNFVIDIETEQEKFKFDSTNKLLQIGQIYPITENDFRIRKLTPKECFRLMGFEDKDYEKAAKVCSNTRLYMQAGNSIVVPVIEAIFENLYNTLKGVFLIEILY